MDSVDMNIRLPPRKRLLAGLRKVNSDCELPVPVPAMSGEMFDRLREVINSPNSSMEEIVEVSSSVALAAAEIAARARAAALQKAEAAAKAKAAARAALEFLDSFGRNGGPSKNRLRKKRVEVKLLYEGNQVVGSKETDEELARKLHRAMNSSPRISNNWHGRCVSPQELGVSGGDGMAANGAPEVKSKEKVPFVAKAEKRKRQSVDSMDIRDYEAKAREVALSKKSKVKRKKLPLSQCNTREQGKPNKLPVAVGYSLTGEPKVECTEKITPLGDGKPSNDGEASMKISSLWKCKKLKVSKCYSDGKVLHGLC